MTPAGASEGLPSSPTCGPPHERSGFMEANLVNPVAPPQASRDGSRPVHTIYALLAVVLAGVAVWSAAYPGILNPWYYNTEEFPFAQEVARFSSGDLRQRFFDIPG